MAQLWPAPDHGGTEAPGLEGWAQAREAAHAEDNLLCVQKRKFVVTTDSHHGLKVYPNLANKMELSGINQLWVADITYIRLEAEFVYLAVVIDSFSRRVVGWALDRTLQDDLPLEALRIAFERPKPASGLVHHSDRWQPVRLPRITPIC
jgi:transposase InsO family protein